MISDCSSDYFSFKFGQESGARRVHCAFGSSLQYNMSSLAIECKR